MAAARPVASVPPPTTPTMREVAAAAGVSKALVSIVLRGAPGASEETRARVLRVADDLGYRANRSASLLKLRRTRHLGVTMSIRRAFHAELVEGIQQAADAAGYEIVLATVTETHSEARAVETLLEFRCESLILLGSELSTDALATLARRLPVVVIGRSRAPRLLDVVRSADDHGQRLLVDHLYALGHRRIAHVDGGRGLISADRRRGFRTAVRRHGLPDALVVPGGGFEADGWAAAGELLARPELPTAVTVYNDNAALGVLGRLGRAGVRVPEDISVAGYDDSAFARFAAVDLTSVNQQAADQAAGAVRAAVERLEGVRPGPAETVLEPRLVARGTTGPIAAVEGK